MEDKKEIFVTQTTLPDEEVYNQYVHNIFLTRSLTNQGVYVKELEEKLRDYLHVHMVEVCANGTLALQMAIRLLNLAGKKVITTPFTYVATVSSLLWENCTPVFADIEADTLCIDPDAVIRALDSHPDASGILPVHVYGNACNVEALKDIAQKNNVPVFYDGAHAFGSIYKGRSLLDYGDTAICSFHATKIFHTVEGGCIITHNGRQDSAVHLLRAFGHINDDYHTLGINAKLSEMHAAMGLSLLPLMPVILEKRARLASIYDEALDLGNNPYIRAPRIVEGLVWNHAYYPVIFSNSAQLVKSMESLGKNGIYPRRYFYPSLTKLPYVEAASCPIAEDISGRVLCLPFWPDMPDELPVKIAGIIHRALVE